MSIVFNCHWFGALPHSEAKAFLNSNGITWSNIENTKERFTQRFFYLFLDLPEHQASTCGLESQLSQLHKRPPEAGGRPRPPEAPVEWMEPLFAGSIFTCEA